MSNIRKKLKTEEKDEIEKEKKENKNALRRFSESARTTLVDLITLEVNTILVSNISAEHPDEDEEFLRQTCKDLVDWLERNKTDSGVQTPFNGRLSQLRDLWDNDKYLKSDDSKQLIKAIKDNIKECLARKQDNLDDEESRKRLEYRRHLDYLQRYLNLHEKWCANNKHKLTDKEHQQLRKLWELVGTIVYAQTVMQLDGDIVSRINDQLFSMAKDNAEDLMYFHSRNVETGVNYRNEVMNTFVQLINSLIPG